ncbi:MAG: hemin uptake protein HemP [Natronohydrobacter sp.]|nr:hemin uptake protein HemP [Natronohydrobacter sp.]
MSCPENRPEISTLLQGHAPDRSDPPVHDAADLLGQGQVALIVLGRETYRLRLTRNGKLILNK